LLPRPAQAKFLPTDGAAMPSTATPRLALTALVLWFSAVSLAAAEAAPSVTDPGPNSADEALAAEFSLARAANFLDAAALTWQNQRGCITCHTNMAYLCARPGVADASPAAAQVRAFVEQLVEKTWPDKGPRYDAEVVAAAAALAINDAATTGKLHPLARAALERMWTLQRDDGGWEWLKCGWPPMESDDHYGVTLAAIAVGIAPDGYAATDAARAGLDKIRAYLKNNPAPTLHHQAMILWAAVRLDGLMTADEKQACIDRLLALQKPDGGWAAATLGDWQRGDGKPQDTDTSDGYGTGFVVFVLRQAGVPADAPAVQRGIAWLKSHQRASGRWFTRSLNKDNKHFLTHAGTAMAVMALSACGEGK
jgi:squalene-hopene/tetraprenyl-beta-curcumene cyclase